MEYFYAPNIEGNTYSFESEEAKHVTKVLRKNIGDTLLITNGKGDLFSATISQSDKKHCVVAITEKSSFQKKFQYQLHIAIAPTKNISRFEWFLEKATEIGISEITPIISENSERDSIKHDRLQKILVAAMKQSGQTWLPKLNEPQSLSQFLKTVNTTSKFIAHCLQQQQNHLKKEYIKSVDTTILIGPEGDFSTSEIKLALANDYIPISLGETRLRTETAGIMACTIVNTLEV